MSIYQYKATIVRVIDGDTLELDAQLGFHVTKRVRVRLRDIDAPEIRGEERAAGRASKAALEVFLAEVSCGVALLPFQAKAAAEAIATTSVKDERPGAYLHVHGCPCTLHSFKGKSFDRWVAEVTVDADGDQVNVGHWMIAQGFATSSAS